MKILGSTKYKPVTHSVITAQFRIAPQALKEEIKFLSLVIPGTRPEKIETARENLLRSTVMDDEITANNGNEFKILDSLRANLRRIIMSLIR